MNPGRVLHIIDPSDTVEVRRQPIAQHRRGIVSLTRQRAAQIHHQREETGGLTRPRRRLDSHHREQRHSWFNPLLDQARRPPGGKKRGHRGVLVVQHVGQNLPRPVLVSGEAVGVLHPVQFRVSHHLLAALQARIINLVLTNHVTMLDRGPAKGRGDGASWRVLVIQVHHQAGAPVVALVRELDTRFDVQGPAGERPASVGGGTEVRRA